MAVFQWEDLVPPDVAKAQRRWDQRQTIIRMRYLGMTFQQIGNSFNLSGERVRQILDRSEGYTSRSPVAIWADPNIAAGEVVMKFEAIQTQRKKLKTIPHQPVVPIKVIAFPFSTDPPLQGWHRVSPHAKPKRGSAPKRIVISNKRAPPKPPKMPQSVFDLIDRARIKAGI